MSEDSPQTQVTIDANLNEANVYGEEKTMYA